MAEEKHEELLVSILKENHSNDIDNNHIKLANKITHKDFRLLHIEELTYEEELPRKEALENVISSLNINGINFIYLLMGDKTKVSFYLGVAKIKDTEEKLELDIDEVESMILKPSIEGNFRGSRTTKFNKNKRNAILDNLESFRRVARIDGVASINEENEEFQGIDRLVDVMTGDEFALMAIADPLPKQDIENIEDTLHSAHNKLAPLGKKSIQESNGETKTEGTAIGTNKSSTEGENEGESNTKTKGVSKGVSESNGYTPSNGGDNNSSSTNSGSNTGSSDTTNSGTSKSETEGSSSTVNNSLAINKGTNISREFSDKIIGEWIEYIDETLLPRVAYGKNKGLFHSGVYILSNDKGVLLKLGNTIKSLFSGTQQNKAPLELTYIEDENEIETIKNLQIPIFKEKHTGNIGRKRLLYSKPRRKLGSWMSTNELSIITALPQKEVVGLALKEEVEFGLNMRNNNIEEENKLLLGNLVKSGNNLDIDISLDKQHLNKHIFIAGVTGSGKTTTCHRILNSTSYPFMVIEPAKTEYRILTKIRDDVMVFTLGDDSVAPFRINPFEFFKGENITARVDMIKANIEAAFDMEAAIPQLIEAALYECYEAYGWDIATSTNSRYEDPFANGAYSFPTLSDLIKQTEKVVDNQGFDDRLKNDYIGSIKARLQGLLIGSKGFMLNTPRSIDFADLIEKNVVLELEEIKSGAEKSLIMGFVLINLNEALKQKNKQDKSFRHITLIEEAHRLLAKYTPGENPSKKLGVETFADMLAEVRKYGESLIIVDQIPNKLTPEVLKNTNTKIVHRLFASDDKDAIGNTMALDDEQKEFLSSLEAGRVIVSNQDFIKPIQVQIKELKELSTTENEEVKEDTIREISLKYYQDNYKRGIIQGLETYKEKPSLQDIEKYLRLNFKGLEVKWRTIFKQGVLKDKDGKIQKEFELKNFLEQNKLIDKLDIISIYIMSKFYITEQKNYDIIENHLNIFLEDVVSNDKKEWNKEDKRILGLQG